MAYENFKPVIWSKHIQRQLEAECTLADGCWKQFEGEAKRGAQVKILGIGRPTIKDYDGNDIDSPEEVPDSSVFLTLDQAKYFNFQVKDIDKAQMTDGVMEALMDESGQGIAEAIDSYVGKLAAGAGGHSASIAVTDADKAAAALGAGILWLRKQKVNRKTKIIADISWELYELLVDKIIELDTNNSQLLKKGFVGMYRDAYIRPSNLLYHDGTDEHCMLRTEKAIALCKGIESVEPYRPEKNFSDAVKGIAVYGGKVVRPKELYVIKAHYSV